MGSEQPHILVVGEAFLDRWLVAKPRALSAEAPIPIFDVQATHEFAGGAANVADHARALGALVEEVVHRGPIKSRLVSGNQQIARWDESDTCAPATKWDVELSAFDGVIVSDYGKGMFTRATPALMTGKIPTFIDTKRSPYEKAYSYGDDIFWFPNLREWSHYADAYNEQEHVLRTEGPDGATYLHYGEPRAHTSSLASDVVSVCGAGDAAIAGFAVEFCKSRSIELALRAAMRAAASAIARPFTGKL